MLVASAVILWTIVFDGLNAANWLVAAIRPRFFWQRWSFAMRINCARATRLARDDANLQAEVTPEERGFSDAPVMLRTLYSMTS